MSLHLDPIRLEQVHGHLSRAYPEEGCGVLVGRDEGARRVVERVVAFENQRADSRHNRYLISPEQLLVVEREAREEGLDVVGFYHSHPEHTAFPSAFDLEHAWPYYSYLIVSVTGGRVMEARAWRLASDRARFEPETLEPSPAEAAAGQRDDPEGSR
jgi:proteasome lid subunit RPN8/RPN11